MKFEKVIPNSAKKGRGGQATTSLTPPGPRQSAEFVSPAFHSYRNTLIFPATNPASPISLYQYMPSGRAAPSITTSLPLMFS